MKFDQDNYDNDYKSGSMITATVVTAIAAFFLIIAAVLFFNKDKVFGNTKTQAPQTAETIVANEDKVMNEELSGYVSDSTLTSDQLDFWDMYDEESSISSITESKNPETDDKTQSSTGKEVDSQETISEEEHKNQTSIMGEDGTLEWISINPYLTKNTFDFSGLVLKGSVMEYYEDSRKVSRMGIDISKEQGLVDFNKVKKAGVEFVMIKVGARGYGSGQLIADENFESNLLGAQKSGLSTGVYFFSQAITEAEAVEEANLVIESLSENKISYPVAYDMEKIKGDTARTDSLNKETRTKIAQAFLKTIKGAGYKTILYGNKEWLLTKINLSSLSEYDIWLSQESDIPDYPYKFNLWQYTYEGTIDGVSGKVDFNISFTDYDAK